MIKLYDANYIYTAADKSMRSSKFKYGTQNFRMHQLTETSALQKELTSGTYEPQEGVKFPIKERGHDRFITSDKMRDKAVTHLICDEYVDPSISKYLIYDNSASQKGKGIGHYRKRFDVHLKRYIKEYGTDGWILFMDYSGFYPNLHHDICIDTLEKFIRRKFGDTEETAAVMAVIRKLFKKFEKDVSRFTDEEIEQMYRTKISPTMNMDVDPKLMTGEKYLRKGVDIGNQLSQNVGILVPYLVDNYVTIVRGCRYYGRYTDDSRIIHQSKEFLMDVFKGIQEIAEQCGLIINKKKTKIVKLSRFFRHLQIGYYTTETGKIYKRISPKTLKRERDRLKAHKRQMDIGKIPYSTVEDCFKSWIGTQWKYMSRRQISNMGETYKSLFGRLPKWKKKHSRLHWLMAHPMQDASRMEVTT